MQRNLVRVREEIGKERRLLYYKRIALYEWKLNPLKQEIGTAEKIQKMVEEKRVREEVEKARKKPVEHTH